MNKYDVLIIGGGAAGLAAAVSAKWQNKKVNIAIVEKNDRVAKKILATGNGRCNYTNTHMDESCFFGDKDFINRVLNEFSSEDAISFFENLGVMPRFEEGRVYPLSNQASAVADALRLYLTENDVDFITNFKVSEIVKTESGFCVGGIYAKKVIVATGGKAQPNLGSDGSGYNLLKKFGHTFNPVREALVSLKTDTELIKGLKGVKVFACVSLFDGKEKIASDKGEILFTDYGVSGIPVMQISRFAQKEMSLVIDMLPHMAKNEVIGEIQKRMYVFPEREGCELFSGMVNKKIAVPLLKYANVQKMTVKAKSFTYENVLKSGEFLKDLKLRVTGNNGMENAQVTAGGIELSEFNPKTMESKLCEGLFAAGEILDCDAVCGGYNLHWAWATGALAGKSACKGIVNKE